MEQFVNHIIKDIDPKDLGALQRYTYIFPTRRGGIHFQNALLANFSQEIFIAPRVLSIQNFVEFVTGRKMTDEMTLLFELYDVYQQFDDQLETFDKFYPWGEILLKDFDEIDKYLVNAEDLYQNIYDLKKIEATFGMDEDAIKAAQSFREVLSADEQSELLQKFLVVWEVVGNVYYSYKMALREKQMSYEGMLYRELVEIIAKKEDRFAKEGSHLVFCGFNALSNAEEAIFDSLLEQERVTFYWDVDKLMLENNWHESGLFLRKYKEKWDSPHSIWITTDFLKSDKKIEIIQSSQNMAQVKTAAKILEQLAEESKSIVEESKNPLKNGESVIVLADENLLFPMLYALPENIQKINVSVGYPALESHLGMLINDIFQLHITKRRGSYQVEYIEKICASGYLQLIDKDGINDLRLKLLTNRMAYMKRDTIEGILHSELIINLFDPIKTSAEFLERVSEFMRDLFASFINPEKIEDHESEQLEASTLQGATLEGAELEEKPNDAIEEPLEVVKDYEMLDIPKENPISSKVLTRYSEEEINKLPFRQEMDFLFYAIKHLLEFQDHLQDHLHRIELPLLRKMFNESLSTLKIPFEGKTDEGLQIMGFLETRTLDFENLFILSVNEGQLPMERKLNSFIPFNLRKAFKMPTFEEQDAIYAYHFYRLLQRAKNVYLLFDGEKNGDNVKERSRYIPQLLRLAEENKKSKSPNFSVNIKRINTPNETIKNDSSPIEIEKTEEIMGLLARYIDHPDKSQEEKDEVKEFSPTTLSTYIRCPLQFYFKHIAELKQERDFTKEIEAGDIGSIVHKALENLYTQLLNKEITEEDIDQLNQADLIKKELEKIIADSPFSFIEQSYKELVGKNVVTFNICRQIIQQVFEKDKDFIPFVIKSVESKPRRVWVETMPNQFVWLKGTIDRVDQLTDAPINALRIVDYKTGAIKFVENHKVEEIESLLEDYFTNSDYAAAFQAYFYAYLFYRNDPQQAVQAGIYALKEINKGVQMLYPENGPISSEFFLVFEHRLKKLIQELMDPKTPFKQTEDEKKCVFCDYREICER